MANQAKPFVAKRRRKLASHNVAGNLAAARQVLKGRWKRHALPTSFQDVGSNIADIHITPSNW